MHPSANRILIIEPHDSAKLSNLIKVAEEQFPEASYSILFRQRRPDSPCSMDTFVLGQEWIGVKVLTGKIVKELRTRSFSRCLLSYDSEMKTKHLNLRMLALAIGAKQIILVEGNQVRYFKRINWFVHTLFYETFVRWSILLCQWFDIAGVYFAGILAILFRLTKRRKGNQKPKIVHVISSLGLGGSQRQL